MKGDRFMRAFARGRWNRMVVLSLACAVMMAAAGGLRAQDEPEGGGGTGEGDGRDNPQRRADDQPPPKRDPSDPKNQLGNLGLIRGLNRIIAPPKQGAWSQLLNQSYLPAAAKAQKLLFFGQYDQAEAAYNALLKQDPANQGYLENDLQAVLLQGQEPDRRRFETKWAALTEGQRSTARMTSLRAEAFESAGKSEEALPLLKAFVDAHPKLDPADAALLHLYVDYGRLLERGANYSAAAGVYDRVVASVSGEIPKDSEAATQWAIAVYRASTLEGKGREKHQAVLYQLAQIRNEDQTYWPAMLVEAEILLACHNEGDAGSAVMQVLDLNPGDLGARFLSVEHAVDQYDFEGAQNQLDEIKKQSDGAMASAYQGRLYLKERLPEKALAPLQEAVRKDPSLPEARGWLAATYYLLNQKDKMNQELSAIRTESDAAAGMHPVALFQAGEVLRDARQFPTAEGFYVLAEKAASWWSEPAAALAEAYLDAGEEDKARATFDVAYQLDPYNLRAVNQIKMLETLQAFATKESKGRLSPGSDKPAFIIRYNPRDEILATLAVDWMEKVRPDIWSYFHITDLPEPTVIEFFPTHDQFSVRTTGLPWIGTVGATSNNVIAMDVPRDAVTGGGAKNALGTFDWARVLRHEYTHVVTLAMTENRIPHWLTEAAAVEQEQSPRDWETCQLLCSNFRAGTLFKIADLNWGFIKPKRTIDRQLAYMQSQWLYEYLVATYGQPKMLEFLQCFHDGLTEPQAWQKTYGKTMQAVDAEFLPWAGKQLESWGLPSEPLPKLAELNAALAKDPNDKQALFDMSWLYASAGGYPDARKNLEKLVALDPANTQARELLGAVLFGMKETDAAKTMLQQVVKEDPKRAVALRTLGFIAMGSRDLDSAANLFTQLQQVRPLDETSYSNLAGIYLAKKESEKAAGQLLELEKHEQYDERIPRKLAELYVEEKKLPDAEAAAFRAVRINPFNAVNHELLAQIFVSEGRVADAVPYWQNATALQPRIAEFWEGLADSQGTLGNKTEAAGAARKAIELQPDSSAKKWLQ